MARFDIYANTGTHAKTTPYLLDVQKQLLEQSSQAFLRSLRSAMQ